MNFSEAFAGAQLMRPYSSKKLLTDKIQKEDIVKLQLELKGKVK